MRSGREFVREGYLRKWAGPKGGFNARMFFLFNDCILWTTSKIDPPTQGTVVSKPWKVSVELPVNNLSVELSDMERAGFENIFGWFSDFGRGVFSAYTRVRLTGQFCRILV